MKVPLRWLSEFIDSGLSPQDLAHRLTMAGLEAEKISVIGDGWDNVFVGHVEAVERHPDADRLVLATVSAGEHRLTVVTGAPNIAAGQVVPLALAGARLIDGHAEGTVYKTLKPGTIRGVRSEGMVCSEKELGLSEEHEGIMVLDDVAPVGAPLAEWLGDTVIEFEITPNLVHDFSVLGIAREVSALTDRPVTLPALYDLDRAPKAGDDFVTIADPDLCARYVAVVIENVANGPSPTWMQRRLLAAGLRTINLPVDVTNYVMLEFGQPQHAFDADTLAGNRIVVRRARDGEMIETLDHQQRMLADDMLVIADAEVATGVAGVMGGFASEISDSTSRIVLESANFNMKSIRATARSLKLRSDASTRFERGLDPNLAWMAAARATQLLLELSPGAAVSSVADVYPRPLERRELTMPFSEIERLLGISYQSKQVLEVLSRLGFTPELVGDHGAELKVSIPTWRSDVSEAADIVEEVARIIGYDSLPERLPIGQTTPVARDPMFQLQRRVRESLVGSGFWEAITYVTVSSDELLRFGGQGDRAPGVLELALESAVRLRNPLQADRDIMRPTLLPSLVSAASENLKHQRSVRFFELARGYLPSQAELPHESNLLAAVLAGDRAEPDRYRTQVEELDFFDAKGAIDEVLDRIGVGPRAYKPVELAYLHPGRAALIAVNGQAIGIIGELRPDRAASFGIEDVRVAVAELDLDAILPITEAVVTGVRAPRFLPVEQDFAIVVSAEVAAGDVEEALRSGAGPLASGFTLFDLYQGPQVGEGKKSLAYRIIFTAPDRALTDAELGKVRDKIARELKRRVGGELRG